MKGSEMTGFKEQIRRLDTYYADSNAAPVISHAAASRSTVSSTSKALRPCLSVNLFVEGHGWVHLTVPAGTSAGIHEPSSLTPKGDFQSLEKQVFDQYVRERLLGEMPDPIRVDQTLEEVNVTLPVREDGIDTPFSRMGGPTATATSLAAVLALSRAAGVCDEVAIYYLYNRIAEADALPPAERMSLPVYMSKIADGGVHGALDNKGRPLNPVQEFLFIPIGYARYTDALEATMEVNARFWRLIRGMNFDIRIGAEGGILSPQLTSAIQVLQLMTLSIRGDSRHEKPLSGMFIGLDVAAGELYGYKEAPGKYYLGKDGRAVFEEEFVDYRQITEYYQKLIRAFPIISIEDPFSDEDECLEHWEYGFPRMNEHVLVITDDVTVTQPERVNMAVKWGVGGLLTKVNQGGSFTRTTKAMQMAKQHDWVRVLSHRSSEAADFVFEAMLAVATGAEFCKVTVGSREGGGGGREARVNWISNANVVWESIMRGVGPGHPEYEVWKRFWGEDVPERERLAGLPYQGALLGRAKCPPSWLKRVHELIKIRYEQAADSSVPIHQQPSYRFGSVGEEPPFLV
jgi:enolase